MHILLPIGIPMSPSGQEISQLSRMFENFITQSTERMMLVVIAGFVLFLIINAYFGIKRARELAKQQAVAEERQAEIQKSMLALIAGQIAASTDRQKQIDAQAEHFSAVSEHNTQILEIHANILKEIHTRVDDTALLAGSVSASIDNLVRDGTKPVRQLAIDLSNHRDFAAMAVAEVLRDIGELKENFVTVNHLLTSIEQKIDSFPRLVEFKTDIDELKAAVEEMTKRCEEVDKRATDELALLPSPVEARPEDAAALTPGAESEAA